MAVKAWRGLVLAGLIAACVHPAWAAQIRVGVLAFQGAERAEKMWEPTIAHLNRTIPDAAFELVPLDLAGIDAAARAGGVDFIITNPGSYVTLESEGLATRLATVESEGRGSPTAAIGAAVIARRGSGIRDLGDLKGKTVAVVSAEAFGGFQVIWRELADVGLSPGRDLRALRTTGFPMERVVWMVRDGAADAGILRTCLLEEEVAEGKVDPGEFVVVGARDGGAGDCATSSRLYPDWPFAKLPATPHPLAKRVAAALLTMPSSGGHAWTAPQDYTSVHALMQELRIGPYARLGQPSVLDVARRHWHWIVVALLGVLWWVVHAARVEVLVRRRTAELELEIAEREKAQREADRHREERDQFSRLGILGEMASNIAHELNQPLAAIVNYARGMARMLDGGHADAVLLADGAQAIAVQAERAGAIIQRIRGFVRRRDARRERLNVNDVVADTLGFFEGMAGRRGIALHVHLAEDLPAVMADRGEIQQVLLNLLQNAVDAMVGHDGAAEGITVRTSVGADGMVKVAVRDAGPGLDADAERRLFEPFFTTKKDGLGLGLSICRTIVESHGGRLWATANPRRGLTLRFTLPVLEEPADD